MLELGIFVLNNVSELMMKSSQMTQEPLTPRERDILYEMVEGFSNVEIAGRLVLSAGTVKWYVKQLYGKLGVHSREEAVSRALALGLAKPLTTASGLNDESGKGCPIINPLPQDVSDRYIGYTEKLGQVETLLRQQARLIAIYGRAGSGKTALACKALWNYRLSAPWLTGIVCLSAVGTGISLNRLFADIGRLLPDKEQVFAEAIARNNELTPSQKTALLLEKIANKNIVVLMDNLETVQKTETGEFAEPGLRQFIEMSVTQSSALTLLITSREPLYLPRALKTREYTISLEDGLPLEDAVALLRQFDPSGLAGLRDAPYPELSEIAGKLGGFPRALESVVGMLLEDPLLRLKDIRHAILHLEGDISASVVEQALAHLSREAMRILEALSIYGKPVSYTALAALVTPYIAESRLHTLTGRLIRSCFVKLSQASQQFSLHPIDQAFCYNQIPAEDHLQQETGGEPFSRASLHKQAARYYRTQRLQRSEWRRLIDLEPQLNEFQHWVKAGDGDEAARVLLEIDRDFLWEWEYKDLLRNSYAALTGLVDDPHLILQVARRRAWLKFFEQTKESEEEFRQILEEARRQGFVKEEADALDDLAQVFRIGSRDLRKGIEYHRQALALYRQIGDQRGEADSLGGLGAIYTFFEPEEAIDYFLEAAKIQQELNNASSLSFVQSMMGAAYENMGELDRARKLFDEAIEIARQGNCLQALSRAYGQLVGLCVLTGENEKIDRLISEAAAISKEIAGVPVTTQMLFFVGQAALYKALTQDFQEGIALMERVMGESAAFQPGLDKLAKFYLSMINLLGGQFEIARNLLPTEVLIRFNVGNIYWIGVLLIKVHERDQAAEFLERILNQSQPEITLHQYFDSIDQSLLPARVVALAGLALLKRDAVMANDSAELASMMAAHRNWQVVLLSALINLLAQEPGGEMLFPVCNVLRNFAAKETKAPG